MLPGDGVVSELTRSVWSTLLGLEAEDGAAGEESAELSASVDITGEWEGTVSISLSTALATRFAARMLSRAEADMSAAEVGDVIAELVHVVGGNLKPALPGPCSVSMPRVGSPNGPAATPMAARYWFQCDGQPFSVTVRERPCRSSES